MSNAHRLIQVILPEADMPKAEEILSDIDPENWWCGNASGQSDRVMVSVLARVGEVQDLLDSLQETMDSCDSHWRVFVLDVAAVMPSLLNEKEEAQLDKEQAVTAREEVYAGVEENASLTLHFCLMTVLSAIVAAMGLVEGEVAVVIGAMVIAPLLGPVLAAALGVTLGSARLLKNAAPAFSVGTLLALAVSFAIGHVVDVARGEGLLANYQDVKLAAFAVALASGVAAAATTAQGARSALVGVVVSTALLPPLVAGGLLAGNGDWEAALAPLFLAAVNVICIALAAELTFFVQGIRPRPETESQGFKTSRNLAVVASLALLVLLVGLSRLL